MARHQNSMAVLGTRQLSGSGCWGRIWGIRPGSRSMDRNFQWQSSGLELQMTTQEPFWAVEIHGIVVPGGMHIRYPAKGVVENFEITLRWRQRHLSQVAPVNARISLFELHTWNSSIDPTSDPVHPSPTGTSLHPADLLTLRFAHTQNVLRALGNCISRRHPPSIAPWRLSFAW